jgi:predicted ATP-dependent protease/tRNA C32,U32 (ribose-2'-O)-methylase TrmJ
VSLVVATTGRPRELYPAPVVPAWEVPGHVLSVEGKVALVFGRETFGLANEELDLAHLIGTIPTAPEQPSLNLAQAVVVFAYELHKALVQGHLPENKETLAEVAALEALFEDLGRYVLEIGFTDPHRYPYAMRRLRRDLPRHFEKASYQRSQSKLLAQLASAREDLMGKMEETAGRHGFSLAIDSTGGIALTPLVEGKVLTSEEYDRLDAPRKRDIKAQSSAVLTALSDLTRQVNRCEQEFRIQEQRLETAHGASLVDRLLAPVRRKFAQHKAVLTHLDQLREDIQVNLDRYQVRPEHHPKPPQEPSPEAYLDSFFQRYEVNLFVDNAETQGAPVVQEINPSFANLLGCIERETEWGALYTDFTLIRPGAIHKANGGYLILRVDDLMGHPLAWEGLLRCLRTQLSRLEDPSDHFDSLRTHSISPEPVPLRVKVILIGDDETYEILYANDERFRKLFKIKAHIQETVDRDAASIQAYAHTLDAMLRHERRRPFTKDAYAALIDHATRLAEDRTRLALAFALQREVMIEAEALARARNVRVVDAEIIRETLRERDYRNGLYHEEFLRDYDRRIIKVRTHGREVGVANGLSVTQIGEYVMGLPHQISCTVGVGHGGIMDLEREAELGGPIHTKGMMILKSYFYNRFAQDKPIVLSGSICFEQSYAEVDGDSASGAELAALLSAISGVPIRLDLAFTGAVSQSGAIMAVGGVAAKVEGFFEVCRRHGLSGTQGVIVPRDNVDNLVLKDEVLEAIRAGGFHIYAVSCIEEAMEILTGMRAGVRCKNGRFSPGSLFAQVDERLSELARLAERTQPRRKNRRSTAAHE